MCFVTEQKVPFVYLTSMEAVIPQGSRGEMSIVLFQLAYKFITSRSSRSPLMDLNNFRHLIFTYNLSNNQVQERNQ